MKFLSETSCESSPQSLLIICLHSYQWTAVTKCHRRSITSYLTDCSQYVKLHTFSSKQQPCKSGVPQGSVLGPLLFTIYVSPVASLLSHLGVNQHQYADDTQLFISITQSSALTNLHTLQSALAVLSQWFSHISPPSMDTFKPNLKTHFFCFPLI
jgi:Reverse transcriptase (RNA-dependent DNA polymerase)